MERQVQALVQSAGMDVEEARALMWARRAAFDRIPLCDAPHAVPLEVLPNTARDLEPPAPRCLPVSLWVRTLADVARMPRGSVSMFDADPLYAGPRDSPLYGAYPRYDGYTAEYLDCCQVFCEGEGRLVTDEATGERTARLCYARLRVLYRDPFWSMLGAGVHNFERFFALRSKRGDNSGGGGPRVRVVDWEVAARELD